MTFLTQNYLKLVFNLTIIHYLLYPALIIIFIYVNSQRGGYKEK